MCLGLLLIVLDHYVQRFFSKLHSVYLTLQALLLYITQLALPPKFCNLLIFEFDDKLQLFYLHFHVSFEKFALRVLVVWLLLSLYIMYELIHLLSVLPTLNILVHHQVICCSWALIRRLILR